MSYQTIYPQDNANNYIFDNTKIEMTGGLSKLIAQVSGAEAYMYAKLDENDGLVALDSSGNEHHGAFQGGYDENQWEPGKINSGIQGLSTTNGFINFDQLIAFERDTAFSLECWMKTTSSATMSFLSKQLNTGALQGFTVNILAGKVRMVIRDASSNVLSIEYNSVINDGNWHHIVMTYDGLSQISGCHLYVDNTQNNNIIASTLLTNTITNSADFQISGRDGNNNTIDANTFIDECVVYRRELSPAEVAFRWNGGAGTQELPGATTAFPTDNPILYPNAGIITNEITGFFADIITSGLDEIRFVLSVNGIDKYWNGSIWEDSAGYAQTNTFTEINSNISSLLTEISSVIWKAYFHSDDGSSTPELLEVYFTYNLTVSGALNYCLVTGKNIDSEGNPDTTPFVVRISADAVVYFTNIIRISDIIITPNLLGEWQIALLETESMPESIYYEFIFRNIIDNFPKTTVYKKDIPNQATINFWDLPDA